MRILIITQKVDLNDSVLGFFHRWVEEFARKFEKVTVICLQKGVYDLPDNVQVLSLGKESDPSRLKYILNFYKYIWQERNNYDVVLVHMNQEYILLGWKLWFLLGKKVYMWRNHKKGNMFTNLAVLFSRKVFCTSKGSYTARFNKTQLMPVGVDEKFFKRRPEVSKIPKSILFLGRLSPVKSVEVFVDAMKILHSRGTEFVSYIYGNPTVVDHEYFSQIKKQAAELEAAGKIIFKDEVPNQKTPEIYNAHEIFVNLTDSGSFDKTIVEAMLCENLVMVSNESLKDMLESQYVFKDRDANDLSDKLAKLLAFNEEEKTRQAAQLREIAKKHSLEKLVSEISAVVNN